MRISTQKYVTNTQTEILEVKNTMIEEKIFLQRFESRTDQVEEEPANLKTNHFKLYSQMSKNNEK